MTNAKTFVSGCDSNYFPILMEWLHSVRSFPQSKDFDICILDAGLKPEQIEILIPLVNHIVNPDWPDKIARHKLKGEYLKACVCRPFIPQMFPGYETYIWMDADTWLQDWRAIDLYLEGANRGKLAITVQADRCYKKQIRVKWLGALPLKIRGFYYSNALKAFGTKTAKELLPYQVLNAGAFALSSDAPHWARWQELVVEAIKRGKVFTAEQLTLGMITYLEDYPVEILPAWTQWLCEFTPYWDEDKMRFVETFLPHEPLGIVHLSGLDKIRLDRSIETEFQTLKGGKIKKSFRYQGYNGETQKPI
jgi:hypothetical protein